MALLHGSWIHSTISAGEVAYAQPSVFFLWGEVWRGAAVPAASIPMHPFGMNPDELSEQLLELIASKELTLPEPVRRTLANPQMGRLKEPGQAVWQEQCLGVLSRWSSDGWAVPLHSAAAGDDDDICLYPVRLQGLCLVADTATEFLLGLPLGSGLGETQESWLGSDLVFWSHVTRWSLDLLVRSKFLPGVASEDRFGDRFGEESGNGFGSAYWQPLLDSALDQARFRQFKDQMPVVCRCLQPVPEQPALKLLPNSAQYLRSCLQTLIDQQIRQRLQGDENLAALKSARSSELSEWLMDLSRVAHPGMQSKRAKPEEIEDAIELETLRAAYSAWIEPVRAALFQNQRFRAAFELAPPLPHSRTWTVTYGLQATDDSSCRIGAETIWMTTANRLTVQRRTLEHPQETLLAGLGLASRVYPLIEESLQNARPSQHQLTPLQAYDFLKAVAWRLEDSGFGVIVPPTLANREGWANRLGLQIRAEVPAGKPAAITLNSLLNFKWELTIGGQRLSKGEFDYLVSQDSPLVEVNGEWVELRAQDIRAAQTFFENRQNQAGLTLQDALRLSTGDALTIEKLPIVKFESTGALEELLNTLSGNQSFEPVEPKNFQGTLRPYQARGVGWLTFLERWNLGACLADDMGLGKTIQLIAFLLHLKAQKRWKDPILLICPTSVLGNWEREIKRFAPKLKVLMHHGPGRAQAKNFVQSAPAFDIILTSYALVHRDESFLTKVDWQGIVLDEAQNIKNPEAQQSQTVRRLQAKCRIALTGTPLENRLLELWSILDFLNPGYLGSRAFFQKRFATPIERYGDTASLQTLRSLAQPFILRRTKTDRDIIQDLPDKQETTVFCNLTREQAALYEKTVQDSLSAVESAEGIQRHGIILATLTKLKQICNHPAQFLKESALKSKVQRSGKLKRLEELLDEALAEGDRALIFTQFAEMGKLLQRYLHNDLKREALLLYGGTSKAQREALIDRFQNDPQGPRLFVLSLKAGGVGLNLTRANHVFHFDRWWNPAVENQATDRVFRIGQTRNVQVHKFVCTGTLEERIHEMIESKKVLADQVIGGGENWLTEMDTDQLRQLLLLDRTAVIDEDV